MFDKYFSIAIVLLVVITFLYATGIFGKLMSFVRKEHAITEPAYLLTSRGLNLQNTGGSYMGAMAVLNAVENANTVSDIAL